MLFSPQLILVHLARFLNSENLICRFTLLMRSFLHVFLLVEGFRVVFTLDCLFFTLHLVVFGVLALLIKISLPLGLPRIFFLLAVKLTYALFLFDRFASLGANVIADILSLFVFMHVALSFALGLNLQHVTLERTIPLLVHL